MPDIGKQSIRTTFIKESGTLNETVRKLPHKTTSLRESKMYQVK